LLRCRLTNSFLPRPQRPRHPRPWGFYRSTPRCLRLLRAFTTPRDGGICYRKRNNKNSTRISARSASSRTNYCRPDTRTSTATLAVLLAAAISLAPARVWDLRHADIARRPCSRRLRPQILAFASSFTPSRIRWPISNAHAATLDSIWYDSQLRPGRHSFTRITAEIVVPF
jgi:hypothetical protein